jgi:hypothetical protein
MIVDVHAHAVSEDFIRVTAANPSYGTPYEVRPTAAMPPAATAGWIA